MEFNEKLQNLRKQKGLTQEELAETLFVSRTAVSKWESGRLLSGVHWVSDIIGGALLSGGLVMLYDSIQFIKNR